MIGYIEGDVVYLNSETGEVIIKTNSGVGYSVETIIVEPITIGTELSLYIFTKFTQDNIYLYGFKEKKELDFFKKLLNISGVGAKTALKLMRNIEINKIYELVNTGESKLLKKLGGISDRTAMKIIIELKGELKMYNQTHDDFYSTLLQLGYTDAEIINVEKDIDFDMPLEDIIKHAIKNIRK